MNTRTLNHPEDREKIFSSEQGWGPVLDQLFPRGLMLLDFDHHRIDRRALLLQRAEQEALLQRWGYPYVMEEFRFHLTLTGRLPVDKITHWTDTARAHLPPLPAPFVMDVVALVAEREDGRFELIQRYTLAG